jgi:hypothetical protein
VNERVKVFISWSGARSKAVATALRGWIPDLIQTVEPWMSQVDMEAGARWGQNIAKELSETTFGIICVTPENINAPWILFEAGALAKTIDEGTFVCPYLIGIEPSDIPPGPLTQFQAKQANEAGTWELIRTLNKAAKENALSENKLKRTFERWWPDLRDALNALPLDASSYAARREPEEMIREILSTVRGIARRSSVDTLLDPLILGALCRIRLEYDLDDPVQRRKIRNWFMYNQGFEYSLPLQKLIDLVDAQKNSPGLNPAADTPEPTESS